MDTSALTHASVREVLRRTGLLPVARCLGQSILGNRHLRRYCTANFSSGKIAIGEKNHYALPLFPLDWIRVDIDGADFNVDLSTSVSLPFANASQRIIYSAHLVEHLDNLCFRRLLRECHRILTPGGALRIETPDIERLIDAYKFGDELLLGSFRTARRKNLVDARGFPTRYLEDHLTVLGEISSYIDPQTHSGHIPVYVARAEFDRQLEGLPLEEFAQWCVSLQTPTQLASGGHRNWMSWHKLNMHLRAAGFERVRRVTLGTTHIPQLKLGRGLGGIREKPHRAAYSIYVEAFKGESTSLGMRSD